MALDYHNGFLELQGGRIRGRTVTDVISLAAQMF